MGYCPWTSPTKRVTGLVQTDNKLDLGIYHNVVKKLLIALANKCYYLVNKNSDKLAK